MDIPSVLKERYPTAKWSLDGEEYSGLDWQDDSPKPTEAELQQAWPDVQSKIANESARLSRMAAFRDEADPLFFGWQRGENTEQSWLDKCEEIRQRFPYTA